MLNTIRVGSLGHACLVACDQSYNEKHVTDEDLWPFLDSPEEIDREFPMPAQWLFDIDGWNFAADLRGSSGFYAIVYKKEVENKKGEYDYIVAVRGSRGFNGEDFNNDLTNGWLSWSQSRDAVLAELNRLTVGANTVTFTGQSLGGALAQYFAYDFEQRGGAPRDKIGLQTFNGLGGLDALSANNKGTFDSNALNSDLVFNYWITNDLVSELGGGHLGGSSTEYNVDLRQPNPDSEGIFWAKTLVDAHKIETGFYAALDSNDSATQLSPMRVDISLNQITASSIASALRGSDDLGSSRNPKAIFFLSTIGSGVIHLPGTVVLFGAYLRHAGLAGLNATREERDRSLKLLENLGAAGALSEGFSKDTALVNAASPTFDKLTLAEQQVVREKTLESLVIRIAQSEGGDFNAALLEVQKAFRAAAAVPGAVEELIVAAQALDAAARFFSVHSDLTDARAVVGNEEAVITLMLKAQDPNARLTAVEQGLASRALAIFAELDGAVLAEGGYTTYLMAQGAQIAKEGSKPVGEAVVQVAQTVFASLATDAHATLLLGEAEAARSVVASATAGAQAFYEGLADSFATFTPKFGVATEVVANLTDAEKRDIVKAAVAQWGTSGAPTGANVLTGIAQQVSAAAQDVVLVAGGAPNPFKANSGFDPRTSAIPGGRLPEGGMQKFTAYLPIAAGPAGQRVHLAFTGTAVSELRFLDGGGRAVDLGTNAAFDLDIAAGQQQASFSVFAAGDITAASDVALQLTLVDASGTPTHTTSQNLSFNVVPDTFEDPVVFGNVVGKESPDGKFTRYETTATEDYVVAGNGTNVIDARVGSNLVYGGTGQDTIIAGDGRNVLVGGGGSDVIVTGNGNNEIYGAVRLTLEDAIEQSRTGAPSGLKGAVISVGAGENTIIGSLGNDAIFTGTGDTTLILGPGNNIVTGGIQLLGADPEWSALVDGGVRWSGVFAAPIDYVAPAGYEGPFWGSVAVGAGSATIIAGSGHNRISLGNGDNYVELGSGSSEVFGAMGDDEIIGGTGDTFIFGGGGDDVIEAGDGNSMVVGASGDNTIYGGAGRTTIYAGMNGQDWFDAEHGDNYVAGGSGPTEIFGSGGSDTLVAGSGDTTIVGGYGDEFIQGGSGRNILVSNSGHHEGGTGRTTIVAGSGETSIQGGAGIDLIRGGTGTNLIVGGTGTSTIYTGDGGTLARPTEVHLQAGANQVFGGAGVATIYGGSGMDVIRAGTGDTTIYGGTGTEDLYSGSGNNLLVAGAGQNTLHGGSGRDILRGTTGPTTFLSGTGDEIFEGGTGRNTYVLASNLGKILIKPGNGADSVAFGPGIALEDLAVNGTVDAGGDTGLEIRLPGGGSVVVQGGLDTPLDTYRFADTGLTVSFKGLLSRVSSTPVVVEGPTGRIAVTTTPGARLEGGDLPAKLYALGGGATIVSGIASDTLVGSGNDTFFVNDAGDVVVEQSGGGTVYSSVDYVMPVNVSTLVLTGADALIARAGNASGVKLVANAGDDILVAGAGSGTIQGGPGRDTFAISRDVGQYTFAAQPGTQAVLRLDGGLASSDLAFARDGKDLIVTVAGSSARIRIQGYASEGAAQWLVSAGSAEGTLKDLVDAPRRAQIVAAEAQALAAAAGASDLAARGFLQTATDTWYRPLQMSQTQTFFLGMFASEFTQTLVYGVDPAHPDHTSVTKTNNWSAPGYIDVNDWTTTIRYDLGRVISESQVDLGPQTSFGGSMADAGMQVVWSRPPSDTSNRSTSQFAINGFMRPDGSFSFQSSFGAVPVKGTAFNVSTQGIYLPSPIGGSVADALVAAPASYASIGSNMAFPSIVPVMVDHQTEIRNVRSISLAAGDHTVYGYADVVDAGTGNNYIEQAGVVDAGTGNNDIDFAKIVFGGAGASHVGFAQEYHGGEGHDTVDRADTAYGGDGATHYGQVRNYFGAAGDDVVANVTEFGQAGSGHQTLYGGWHATLAAGSGDATLVGTGEDVSFEIDPNSHANVMLGGRVQSEEWQLLDGYYRAQGITDWFSRYTQGNTYQTPWGVMNPFPADFFARALLGMDAQQAVSQGLFTFVQALPDVVEVAGGSIRPGSGYAFSGIPQRTIHATDFQFLAPLVAQGFLAGDTVRFGAGITAADLHVSWGVANVSMSGLDGEKSNYATLNIQCGPDGALVRILCPHSDDPVGSGVQDFVFGDGTTMSMADMLALAPPLASFDVPGHRLYELDASVASSLGAEPAVVHLAAAASVVAVSRSGLDLILSRTDTGDSTRIIDWYAGAGLLPRIELWCDDGSVLSAAALTERTLVQDGSAGGVTLDGLVGFRNTLVAGPGDVLNGGSNADLYVYNPGSGAVRINALGGSSRLQFGAGITPDMIGLEVDAAGGLTIVLGIGSDRISLGGFDRSNAENTAKVTAFEFADGSLLTWSELAQRGFDVLGDGAGGTVQGTDLVNRIHGTAGDDVLLGTGTQNTLYGVAGNDTLIAGSGADVLIGGSGNTRFVAGSGGDTLIAGAGANTFAVGRFTGHLVIDESQKALLESSAADVIELHDVNVRSLFFEQAGDDLIVHDGFWWGSTNNVTLRGADLATGTGNLAALAFVDEKGESLRYSIDEQGHALSWYAADGFRYTERWEHNDGSTGVTFAWEPTGEVWGWVTSPDQTTTRGFDHLVHPDGTTEDWDDLSDPSGYLFVYRRVQPDGSYEEDRQFTAADGSFSERLTDYTVLPDGAADSAITSTNTDGSTYRTDTVNHQDGAYEQAWSRSDGSWGSVRVDAAGVTLGQAGSTDAGGEFVASGSGRLDVGTSSSDVLVMSSPAAMLIGGQGDDVVQVQAGAAVVAHDLGDGHDMIVGQADALTLSLDAGLRATALNLQKSGTDLVLNAGAADSLAFKDWYASDAHGTINLQFIASPDTSTNEVFDFGALAAAYDVARGASADAWAISSSMLDAHLLSSTTGAIGADLALYYAGRGSLAGFDAGRAMDNLRSPLFAAGSEPAALWSGPVASGSAALR